MLLRISHLALIAVIIGSLPVLGASTARETAPARERVLVTDVIDGDTIIVLRGRRQETVRLIGVDAPETGRPATPVRFYGPEATDFTRRSLLKQRVTLEFESPDRPGGSRDAYHRTLAYVFTDGGLNFNLELVRLGYGRVYARYPFRHQRAFEEAQHEARSAGLGMWDRTKRAEWSDPSRRGTVIGNLRTGIYHLPDQKFYDQVREKNRIYFKSEEEARKAGYRKARD